MASYAPVLQKIEGWISVLYIRLFRPDYSLVDIRYLALAGFSRLASYIKTADCRPLGVFSSRWKECRLNFRLNDRLQWLAFRHPNYYSLFLTHNFAQITRNYSSAHLTIACSRHSVFGGEWKRWGNEGNTTWELSRHSFTDRRQFWRIRERFPSPFFIDWEPYTILSVR